MVGWQAEFPAVEAHHVADLRLLQAADHVIWEAARAAGAVVVTKDADFRDRVVQRGAPPQIVWVTTGNLSNRGLKAHVIAAWPRVLTLLRLGEALVEIRATAVFPPRPQS
jgi:predicted nuclease of predicted toxin-antitoxin system